ncbi:MAG: alcohol dehydrogenase catalytic domain-containing protein [Actinobacteria bacterium]|nr:alcohol dehydrogenase catalytic domain-containing protein [Actinomycetota bacterium]
MTATPTMTCIVCIGDRQVEVRQVPIVAPGPEEVRVRIVASAICGSDLHQYRQSAAERARLGYSRFALGHEGAGVVEAVGPGVVHPKLGDRVVVYHLAGCGHCVHCRRGEPGFCAEIRSFSRVWHGSDAESMVLPARNALPLPDDFDFVDGALLACNVGTAYGALKKAGASADTTLAVFGLGPVGLYTVMLGRAFGAAVAGVDVQPSRRQLAQELGAEAVFDGADPATVAKLKAFGAGEGVHASIDTSGAVAARTNAIDALRVHGTYVEVGVSHDTTIRPSQQLMAKEVTLRGSWIFKLYEWEDLLAFLRRHRLPIQRVVTHRVRPAQAVEMFHLADAATAGKIVFDWS